MVVDGISIRAAGAGREASAADGGDMRRGMVLDARILEITDKGTVRVSTRFGEFQVPLPPKDGALSAAIAAGRFRLLVGDVDAARGQLQLTVLTASPTKDAAAATGADLADRLPDAARPSTPTDPAAIRRQVLTEAVRVAAGRHDGMAKLFVGLDRLVADPAAPRPVREAAAAVGALRLAVDAGPDAAAVKQAVADSGLFHEADLAGAGPSAAAPATRDLKAALLRLDRALTDWLGSETAGSGGRPAGAAIARQGSEVPVATGAQPGAALPSTPPTATSPTATSPTGPATPTATAPELARPGVPPAAPGAPATAAPASPTPSGPEAAPVPASAAPTAHADPPSAAPAAPSGSNPPQTSPGAPTGSTPTSTAADPRRAVPGPVGAEPGTSRPADPPPVRLADAQSLARVLQTLAGQAAATLRTLAGEPKTEDGASPSGDRPTPRPRASAEPLEHVPPPPPRRGGPIHAEPAVAADWLSGVPTHEVGRIAKGETEAALARVFLSQAASVAPEPEAGQPGEKPALQQWTFDVPLLSRGETSIAQFRIEREEHRSPNAAEPTRPTWRIRFSVDFAPIGPVHALLSLMGGRLAVGLWTERPDAAALLGAGVGELRNALEAGNLEVEEIHLATGRPAVPEPAPTGTFLDRSA